MDGEGGRVDEGDYSGPWSRTEDLHRGHSLACFVDADTNGCIWSLTKELEPCS